MPACDGCFLYVLFFVLNAMEKTYCHFPVSFNGKPPLNILFDILKFPIKPPLLDASVIVLQTPKGNKQTNNKAMHNQDSALKLSLVEGSGGEDPL